MANVKWRTPQNNYFFQKTCSFIGISEADIGNMKGGEKQNNDKYIYIYKRKLGSLEGLSPQKPYYETLFFIKTSIKFQQKHSTKHRVKK